MDHTLAFINIPGGPEWIIVLVIALLIFGKRLPEVGRSIGKGLVEFKKGLKGVKDELDDVDSEVRRAGEIEEESRRPAIDSKPTDAATTGTTNTKQKEPASASE